MPTEDPGSITRWLGAPKGGDLDAARPIGERHFVQPVRAAIIVRS